MFIQDFVSKFNLEIKNKINSGFFNEEYFVTCDYNYQSKVHSRVQAIIVKICYELGFNVEVERGFNYNDNVGKRKTKRFKPDITIYDKNKLFAFIEYESTNSSDSRFFDGENWSTSDLRCLLKYTQSNPNNLPKYWVIISTLPKCEIISKRWKSWEYNKSDPKFKKIITSPFNYYFPKYVQETQKILDKIETNSKICLLNLDRNKVSIEKEF